MTESKENFTRWSSTKQLKKPAFLKIIQIHSRALHSNGLNEKFNKTKCELRYRVHSIFYILLVFKF